MNHVQKGVISSIEGEMVRIKPYGSENLVTPLIDGRGAEYKVGEIVAFTVYDDDTGFIFGIMRR